MITDWCHQFFPTNVRYCLFFFFFWSQYHPHPLLWSRLKKLQDTASLWLGWNQIGPMGWSWSMKSSIMRRYYVNEQGSSPFSLLPLLLFTLLPSSFLPSLFLYSFWPVTNSGILVNLKAKCIWLSSQVQLWILCIKLLVLKNRKNTLCSNITVFFLSSHESQDS